MDILFITLGAIEATFSSSFRNRAIVKGLIELGHKVDVLTTAPDNSNIAVKNLSVLKKANIVKIDKTIKTNTPSINNNPIKSKIIQFIRKAYNTFFLFGASYYTAKKVDISVLPKSQYDIIISSSDPKTSHILANNLIKKGLKYNKWIQYWGDPLANDITHKYIYPKKIVMRAEGRVLKNADKIIYVSPFTLNEQKTIFQHLAYKMFFLPVPYESEKIYETTKNDKYTVGYFGYYLSYARNIMPLYEAFKMLDSSVHLNIVGGTDIRLKSTENISVFPISNKISEFEKDCDLLVVILNSQGSQIPGKVYHAAATNRPVLVVLDGERKNEIKAYLETYERFEFCENNPESIAVSITRIIEHNKKYRPCKALSSETIVTSFLKEL